jgi:hypothetical protein
MSFPSSFFFFVLVYYFIIYVYFTYLCKQIKHHSLRGKERAEWGSRGCDTVVATGRSFSCDDSWGSHKYFTSWKVKEEVKCEGKHSRVTCRTHSASSSTACVHENVVIDFNKVFNFCCYTHTHE